MSKNDRITSFFKPATKPPHNPAASPAPSSRPAPSSPSWLRHNSSPPSTPTKSGDGHATIRDSDDAGSDGSDDSSLPDILAPRLPPTAPIVAAAAATNHRAAESPTATPKAKRTALDFHSSPLAIIPKHRQEHRFDMDALLSHVRRDEAADESARRVAALLEEEEEEEEEEDVATAARVAGDAPRVDGAGAAPTASFYDVILDVLPDKAVGEEGQLDRERVLRAVKRTEAAAKRKAWYFFRQDAAQQPQRPKNRFPEQAALRPWRFLARSETRRSDLSRGLASTILRSRGHELPSEMFLWLLVEICWERDDLLSQEYISIATLCGDQVRKFMDEQRIRRLLEQVSATEQACDLSKQLHGVPELDDPYGTRNNWHGLHSVLRLLSAVAGSLSLRSLTYATGVLIRLGIDPVVHRNVDLFPEYGKAIENLLSSVSPHKWNEFCDEVATTLHNTVREATLRWDAVASLPSGKPAFQDFRRRLAVVFFFDDPSLAQQHADATFSVRAVLDRLEDADFAVDRETDYHELAAHMYLLNIVVDDGSPPPPESPQSEEQRFNADVDGLAAVLAALEHKIPHSTGGGYSSRLEARAVLGALRNRLPYSVRTRPPKKTDIYDKAMAEDDLNRPRQQLFMQKFFKKGTPDDLGARDETLGAA